MPDMITARYKLKDIFPQIASSVNTRLKSYDINPDAAEFIRKGIIPRDMRFEDDENAVISYITTNAKDRDNEIIDPKGAILEDYEAHPVVLFGHDYYSLPIGKCTSIKRDNKGLIAKTKYYNKGMGQEVFDYRKAGFPMAESIGFIPLEYKRYEDGDASEDAKNGVQRKYTKWVLLEYSDVPIPSNPEALMLAISKGLVPVKLADVDKSGNYTLLLESDNKYIHFNNQIDKNKITQVLIDYGGLLQKQDLNPFDIDEFTEKNNIVIVEKSETAYSFSDKEPETEIENKDTVVITKPGWDETEDMIRYRIRDPKLFRDDTMRTVKIKKDKPRVNSVMGKLKKNDGKDDDPMTMQNVMFPKEDKWTLDEAKAWLKEHDDLLKLIDDILLAYKDYDVDGFQEAVYELFESAKSVNDDLKAEEIIEKSGRTLSAKTRKTINDAVSAMTAANEALNKLLSEADKIDNEEPKTIDKPETKEEKIISLEEMQSLILNDNGHKKHRVNKLELSGMFTEAVYEIDKEKKQKAEEEIMRNKGIVQL